MELKQTYKISIESEGDYKESKQFRVATELSTEEFLNLCGVIWEELEKPVSQDKES